MTSKVLSFAYCLLLLCGVAVIRVGDLNIIDVLQVVVDGAVVLRRYLSHCLMQDQVALIVDTHQLALEDAIILGGDLDSATNKLVVDLLFGVASLHLRLS